MGMGQSGSPLRQLRDLFAAGTATGLSDSELLERYTAKRVESAEASTAAEMAFAALVDRHGAMVWGVCHRVLGDAHEAEDAFQGTFLVLQGMTYDQAARQLNWPVATVKSRLTKGRLRLRARLAQRGLAPGAVAVGVATALTGEARAAVPQELVQSTTRAATACAKGAFSSAVTNLTEGVLKMMMWEKLKLAALGVVVAVGLTAHALS